MSFTRIYRIFATAKNRCNNKSNKDYKNYGGRGISFQWIEFLDFKKDMYKSYLNHVEINGEENTSIDRIDVNGNYCKENCRWATRKIQQRNRKNSFLYKGKTIGEWSEITGIKSGTIKSRLKRHLADEKILSKKLFKVNLLTK